MNDVQIEISSDKTFIKIVDNRPKPTTQEEYLQRSLEYIQEIKRLENE